MDIRASDDYQKGHVPRAINLPLKEWDKVAEKLDKKN
ncbi:rhodanese-like domain-containing protein [Candidatus Coxiella mudrowiae]|nr:rhodanese-like domain-containing protein [Candidatus Coxiella mudrowiae]